MGAATAASVSASKTVEAAITGKHRDVRGQIFAASLLLMLLLSLALLIVLVVSVLVAAWPTLSSRGVDFVTSNVSSFPDKAGVWQGLVGSLILIAFVAILAVPIGVAAAIYLQEYARDTRANRLLVTNIRNLAGVPAIVYGILGVVIFAQALQAITGPKVNGRSLIAGGLTLSVLVMPFVIIITMEALRTVPKGIRDAAYGVGATRWEVVRSHVLPYAAPGVFTGVILAIARAFGETAPLLLVGSVTGFLATGHQGVLESLQGKYTALPTIVFAWSRLPANLWKANTSAAIVVLLGSILVVNFLAIVLRNRYERKW
jgi:phosphate transport system permease protein